MSTYLSSNHIESGRRFYPAPSVHFLLGTLATVLPTLYEATSIDYLYFLLFMASIFKKVRFFYLSASRAKFGHTLNMLSCSFWQIWTLSSLATRHLLYVAIDLWQNLGKRVKWNPISSPACVGCFTPYVYFLLGLENGL
jgi:hypothetical protein